MHKLTHELLKDGCHSLNMDKIITDYLKGRAEWLKESSKGNIVVDVDNIDQAFELSPKESSRQDKDGNPIGD